MAHYSVVVCMIGLNSASIRAALSCLIRLYLSSSVQINMRWLEVIYKKKSSFRFDVYAGLYISMEKKYKAMEKQSLHCSVLYLTHLKHRKPHLLMNSEQFHQSLLSPASHRIPAAIVIAAIIHALSAYLWPLSKWHFTDGHFSTNVKSNRCAGHDATPRRCVSIYGHGVMFHHIPAVPDALVACRFASVARLSFRQPVMTSLSQTMRLSFKQGGHS